MLDWVVVMVVGKGLLRAEYKRELQKGIGDDLDDD